MNFNEIILNFISEYGTTLLYAIITFIFGLIGTMCKNLVQKYLNDKTKQAIAKTVVQAIEQIYKDLHGEEKLDMAIASATEMLAEKGINVTELEIRMLIEAAVGEFNEAFKKTQAFENTKSTTELTE